MQINATTSICQARSSGNNKCKINRGNLNFLGNLNPKFVDMSYFLRQMSLYDYNSELLLGIKSKLAKVLNTNPTFAQFIPIASKIQNVGKGRVAFAPTSKKDNYIGTSSLGTCIGLALVGKKECEITKIAVSHLNRLHCTPLSHIYYQIAESGADKIEITFVSSHADEDSCVCKTLSHLLRIDYESNLNLITQTNMALRASTAMAVNTKTGEISINIPEKYYDFFPLT